MKQLPARVSRFRLLWEWLLRAFRKTESKLKERWFSRELNKFHRSVKRHTGTWGTVLSARTIANAIKRKRGEL